MNEITELRKFYYDGYQSFQNDNFENYVFKDIDFRKHKKSARFFRCDFRGTKIHNIYFYKNDFSRSDFIDSYVDKCSFEKCKFSTDFFNTFFHEIEFKENKQKISSLINCVFNSCEFIKEEFIETTLRDCSFENCIFTDCTFVMNTIDNIRFIKCKFINIDFSNTTAQDFSFSDCEYEKFIINPDNLGTYLFKNTTLRKIIYSYKGEEFQIGENYLNNIEVLIKYYGQMKRYYEFFNLVIIYNYISKRRKPVDKFFKFVLMNTIKDSHKLRKQKNLEKLFYTLEFYIDSKIVSVLDYFSILSDLEATDIHEFDFEEQIKFLSKINALKLNFEKNIFEWNSVKFIPINVPVLAQIVIDEKEENKFLKLLNDFFTHAAIQYLSAKNGKGYYTIISRKKGSLVYEIVSYSTAFIVLATSLRIVSSSIFNIYFDYTMLKKSTQLLSEKKLQCELEEIEKLRRKTIERPIKELEKTAKKLSSFVKSIKIFVNAFKD